MEHTRHRLVWSCAALTALPGMAIAAVDGGPDRCPRPQPGSTIVEPRDLRAQHGVLQLDLSVRDQREADGSVRYCYLTADGAQSPTLRLQPGELLVLRLRNELIDPLSDASASHPANDHGAVAPVLSDSRATAPDGHAAALSDGHATAPCTNGAMSPIATNLHFHGLTVPPVCHQDEVLTTSIEPDDPPFEYRFRVPADEPPGLYWYHPHIHGFSKLQVLGGASGALIIEGLERATPEVAGLPERVLVIRDQDLLHPDALPSKSEPVVPKMMIDRDGDAANNGTGFGKPAKDLSVNFVPVPYPDYLPARVEMKPDGREVWRVLNASAITYLNLAVLYGHAAQPLGVVAIDGVPLTANVNAPNPVAVADHVGLPPGARAEFIVKGPPESTPALLVTRTVDTGAGGENDPNRALLSIVAKRESAHTQSSLPYAHQPLAAPKLSWIGDVSPVRVRKLYFSEKLSDPSDPKSATDFYLTVDGQTPMSFDPASTQPNIVVKQGDVEDWIIENRTNELHDFHIHQLHFQLLEWSGVPVAEAFLRDTVNVPYYNGRMLQYPSVRLRMDFRNANAIGTFVYHCHLLEHEDGGMMGTIRVDPSS